MFDFNNNELENYPLNIFTKLYAENKNNKVYEQCLQEEVKKVIDDLSKDMNISDVMALKCLIDLNKKAVEENNVELDEVLAVRMKVMKQIIDTVYENLEKGGTND